MTQARVAQRALLELTRQHPGANIAVGLTSKDGAPAVQVNIVEAAGFVVPETIEGVPVVVRHTEQPVAY